MFEAGLESNVAVSSLIESPPDLLRSNIPEYSCVGFACAKSTSNGVTLTLGLVTGLPFPESRPIRVLMSADECRDLAAALARMAQRSHEH